MILFNDVSSDVFIGVFIDLVNDVFIDVFISVSIGVFIDVFNFLRFYKLIPDDRQSWPNARDATASKNHIFWGLEFGCNYFSHFL